MFGELKSKLDNILLNTYMDKPKFKGNLKSILNTLNENKKLKEYYLLYSQIENKKFDNSESAIEFLEETVSVLKNSKKRLPKSSFNKVIKNNKNYLTEYYNPIYNKLDKLIFNEGVSDIEERVKFKKQLVTHMTKKQTIVSESVNPSILANISTSKYNEKYNSLTESEKKTLHEINSMDSKTFHKNYSKLVVETNQKLEKMINESSDEEMKNKLIQTKNKITKTERNKVSFFKLRELNNNL